MLTRLRSWRFPAWLCLWGGLVVVVFGQQLVLQACCGGNCNSYTQPEEMFGVACCAFNPMNQFEDICCDNVTRPRRQGSSFVDRCCGNQTLAYDQTCCQGIVHNIPNGECCADQAYSRTNANALCCNGTLNLNVAAGSQCCGSVPFDGGIRESCCGGQVYLRDIFDGCCPNPYLNSTYTPYSTRTSICCDMPIEKTGSMKCCYLRASNGTFTPQSYNYTTNCCAYPYTQITYKVNGTCVNPNGNINLG
uniref:CC domain-containing protein n=1 Tax=Panagrellus redivivus TaxID=6233 RepID=A0A7E4VAT9_PANRE